MEFAHVSGRMRMCCACGDLTCRHSTATRHQPKHLSQVRTRRFREAFRCSLVWYSWTAIFQVVLFCCIVVHGGRHRRIAGTPSSVATLWSETVLQTPHGNLLHLPFRTYSEGVVRVSHYGHYMRACADGFDDYTRLVTCRQLGYERVEDTPTRQGSSGDGGSVDAHGRDKSIHLLNYNSVTRKYIGANVTCTPGEGCGDYRAISTCQTEHAPYLKCSSPVAKEGTFRLVGGHERNEGRLEVSENGMWSAICWDHIYTNHTLDLVCREMGFAGLRLAGRANGPSVNGAPMPSSRAIHYCQDQHENISSCPVVQHKSACVLHKWWIHLECAQQPSDVVSMDVSNVSDFFILRKRALTGRKLRFEEVRLIGSVPTEGRVELRVNGQWTLLCNYGWNLHAANLVCKHLGFGHGATRITGVDVSQFAPEPVYEGIVCPLGARALSECEIPQTNGKCHMQSARDVAATVVCNATGPRNLTLSGVTEGFPMESGVRGPALCMLNFRVFHATLICRTLGFHGGHVEHRVASTALLLTRNASSQSTVKAIVSCKNTASTISDCMMATLPAAECHEYPYIFCNRQTDKKPSGSVQLLDEREVRSGVFRGRLGLTVDGVSGTVCGSVACSGHQPWSQQNSDVACHHLGFRAGAVAWRLASSAVSGSYGELRVFRNISCHGKERSLLQCEFSPWAPQPQHNHSQDVILDCAHNQVVLASDSSLRSLLMIGIPCTVSAVGITLLVVNFLSKHIGKRVSDSVLPVPHSHTPRQSFQSGEITVPNKHGSADSFAARSAITTAEGCTSRMSLTCAIPPGSPRPSRNSIAPPLQQPPHWSRMDEHRQQNYRSKPRRVSQGCAAQSSNESITPYCSSSGSLPVCLIRNLAPGSPRGATTGLAQMLEQQHRRSSFDLTEEENEPQSTRQSDKAMHMPAGNKGPGATNAYEEISPRSLKMAAGTCERPVSRVNGSIEELDTISLQSYSCPDFGDYKQSREEAEQQHASQLNQHHTSSPGLLQRRQRRRRSTGFKHLSVRIPQSCSLLRDHGRQLRIERAESLSKDSGICAVNSRADCSELATCEQEFPAPPPVPSGAIRPNLITTGKRNSGATAAPDGGGGGG
eukprot:scpid29340/ scgid2743/ Scavenger receptor cysteine-rich type 1 protein M160; CD163 antigen-like 1